MDSRDGRDITRTQSRTVACKLRKLAEKIDQGGRQSGLELLPSASPYFAKMQD
jgi:hypothetical protein